MAKKKRRQQRSPKKRGATAKASHSQARVRNSRSARVASLGKNGRGVVRPQRVLDPRIAQALGTYEEAMRLFSQQNYRRAKEGFEKVVAGPSRELAERARVHLVMCEQRLQRSAPVALRTADDHYHYAVSQINLGNYEQAGVHLERARRLAPKADYVYYALASVASLTGDAEEALDCLAQAIKLRPENRYHARNDADFKLLEDDARFHELVNPVRPAGPGLGPARA